MSSTHRVISSGGEEAGGVSRHLSSITGGVLWGLGDNPEVPLAPLPPRAKEYGFWWVELGLMVAEDEWLLQGH